MKDSALSFDRKKHLLYSKTAKEVIRSYLHSRWGQEAEALWERTQCIYVSFLETMPDLGGRHNFQAGSVYDCVALFACWEAVPVKPTLEELEAMNDALFVPAFQRTWKVEDLNRPLLLRAAHAVFSFLAGRGRKHAARWPGNYHMEVEPYDPAEGVRYRFTTCPIADFARAHGYEHLMPAMCNGDYRMLAAIHGGLIRTTTCANGSCCDYWITGDRSPFLDEHPLRRDEAGYLYNE